MIYLFLSDFPIMIDVVQFERLVINLTHVIDSQITMMLEIKKLKLPLVFNLKFLNWARRKHFLFCNVFSDFNAPVMRAVEEEQGCEFGLDPLVKL